MYNYQIIGILDLLTDNNKLTLNVGTKVTDQEKALIRVVNYFFS